MAVNIVRKPERKVDAAEFFLARLEREREDPRAVYHYASALLTAARSVNDALHRESGKAYEFWRDQWERNLAPDDLGYLKVFRALRNADVHEAILPLNLTVDVGSILADATSDWLSGTGLKAASVANVWKTLPLLAHASVNLDGHIVYKLESEQDVLDLLEGCRRLVGLCRRRVSEFRASQGASVS
jgi:hypothetical protein